MKMKKMLWALLALALVIWLGTGIVTEAKADPDVVVDGIGYVFRSGNTAEVKSWGNIPNDGKVEIPATITVEGVQDPYTVTGIGDNAFNDCRNLTGITIPETVTSIGNDAFTNCDKLESITIPTSVTSIGDSAFANCQKLESITFTNNSALESLGEYAFYHSGITSIKIPASVTTIGSGAFVFCCNLAAINVSDGNPNYSSDGGVLFDKNKTTLLCYPTGKDQASYTIPNTVTSIGEEAFYYSQLNNVIIPYGVTSIGASAFQEAHLTSVIIPTSVNSVGDFAFLGSWLKDIYFGNKTIGENADIPSETIKHYYDTWDAVTWSISEDETILTILSGQMMNYSETYTPRWLKYKDKATSLVTLDGLTRIGNCAFKGFSKLTSVKVSATVTEIAYSAFDSCSGLTSFTVPAGVTEIVSGAFAGCSNLTGITVAEGNNNFISVDGVLYNKDKTTLVQYPAGKTDSSFIVPPGVTTIGANAFSGCSHLVDVYVLLGRDTSGADFHDNTTLHNYYNEPDGLWWMLEPVTNAWNGAKALTILSSGAMPDFSSPDEQPWKDERGNIFTVVFTDGVTGIGKYAFSSCKIDNVTISGNVKTIGDCAFQACTGLNGLTIEEGVTTIGDSAFSRCNNPMMKSVTIPASVTAIGAYAFESCSYLTTLTFADNSNLKTIGEWAFQFCTRLPGVTLPESLTGIGDYAFYNCTSLTSIEIPAGVTTIGMNPFRACSSLAEITVNAGNESFTADNGVLYNKDKTAVVVYPAGKTAESYTMPASVTGVAQEAFANCNNLKQVIALPEKPPADQGWYSGGVSFLVRSAAYKTADGWKSFSDKMTVISMVTTDDGVTATGAPAVTDNNIKYYAEGDTLVLSGSIGGYCAKNAAGKNITAAVISGTKLTMPDCDVTVGENTSCTITFKVVGGTWEGGKTDDVKVILSRDKDEDLALVLHSEQIPVPGGPAAAYKEPGAWDVTPDIYTSFSKDTTFTYSYTEKGAIVPEVSMSGYVYGSTPVTPTVSGNSGNGTVTYYYTTKNQASGGKKWSVSAPPQLDAGTYHMYATVEETEDYTSAVTAPVAFAVSQANSTPAAVTANNRTYDGTEKPLVTVDESNLAGGKMQYALGEDDKTGPETGWDNAIPAGTDAKTYFVWYKVAGDGNYSDSDEFCVTAAIAPKKVTITALDAKKLYDGTALTEAGFTASALEAGDTHVFTVTMTADSTRTEGGSQANVIATVDGTAVKTGEETTVGNYLVTTADGSLTVVPKIASTVTFKVENGAWDDGTTEAKTVVLEGWEGDILKLAAADIPTAGSKPDNTFKAGGWDKEPVADTEITADTAYTYTYAKKDAISATVTFKVENGSWNDGKTEAKTVMLEGWEGDTLKLAASDIPAAGSKPTDNTYMAGSWDVTPDVGTAITKDTAYTYTYAKKEAARITKAPAANDLTYNGQPQKLVTAGEATGGTLQYAIGKNDSVAPAEGWQEDVVEAAGAEPYYVWYKAAGDATHTDSGEYCEFVVIGQKSITGATVTLDKTQLTYNGSEQAVAVTGVTVDGLTLAADDYDVTGNKGTDKDDYSVTVTGKGNFRDTAAAEWSIVEKAMTVSAENVSAEYDGKAHGITVTVTDPAEGAAVKYGKTEGTYDLAESPAITDAGTLTVYYQATAANYSDYAGKATVTVGQAASAVKTAPKPAEGLVANGKDQALVIAGTAEGGTMQYARGADGTAEPAADKYGETVPTGREAKTYYVWYKVSGDANHIDTKPAKVEAAIAEPEPEAISAKVTFKVVNGAWDDGKTEDIAVTLEGLEGDTLTLPADKIPAVGQKPAETYKAGSWDVTPVAEIAITADVVYTYTYAEKEAISAKVTFKVVNGSWDDGNAADVTVTLEGLEGETLTLPADKIPTVGQKPAETFKAGGWDVTPVAGTAITADTTYTYTYAEKEAISAKVTYKVVNGAWDDGTTEEIAVTLEGLEGDTLKLTADKIPAVGQKPAETYKAGGWDTAPVADTAITADTTYTYTYAEKDAISAKVTFKVVNGAWDDGTTEDLEVKLTGFEGDTLTLAAADIPAVGQKPAETYKAGGWDTAPVADTAITADTTYTYTYAEKDVISSTVTFKVVNGAWNDGTTEDLEVKLAGFEGDTLTLAAADIPAAGQKPAETFKAGGWDTAPVAGAAITADTTYTYTYAEKDTISATVTFKVINGAWDDGTTADITVTLAGFEGDQLYLAVDDVPDVGSKPAEGYAAEGKWDTEPSVADEELGLVSGEPITKDMTYTYTYAVIPPDPDREIKAYVSRYYQVLLGREPDPEGLAGWTEALKSGKASAAEIVRGFACSEEFTLKYQTNAAIVRALYRAVLGREPDPEGLDAWANVLSDNSPIEAVIKGLCGSVEFGELCKQYGIEPGTVEVPAVLPESAKRIKIEAFVKRCYYVILGRFPDEEGLKGWSDALQTGAAYAARIVEGFVCSEEFMNMKLSNEAIVKVLYRAMLDRTADPEGLKGWTKALDDGYTLQHIINGFCGSVEFTNLCNLYGIVPGSLAVGGAVVKREGITPEGEGEAAPVVIRERISEYTDEEKIRAFVEHCYVSVFGREGDAEGIGNYTALILDGRKTPKSVAREFIFSPEFQSKLPGNEAFIRILYKLYFNREADAEGLAGWVTMLENGASLEDIVNGFAASDEFKAIVNEMKD